MTINPKVDNFLTIYSQSDRSTGGTRGYDPETYVKTKLDRNLIPRILNRETKLVILTGNAGDGKTAFIQYVEKLTEDQGAKVSNRTENGSTFTLNGVQYQTLYDGSQDFEGTANDAVLAAFFHQAEGEKPPEGNFTKVIATKGCVGSETIFSARVADETQPGNANYPGKSIRNQIPFVSAEFQRDVRKRRTMIHDLEQIEYRRGSSRRA